MHTGKQTERQVSIEVAQGCERQLSQQLLCQVFHTLTVKRREVCDDLTKVSNQRLACRHGTANNCRGNTFCNSAWAPHLCQQLPNQLVHSA